MGLVYDMGLRVVECRVIYDMGLRTAECQETNVFQAESGGIFV